MRIKILYSSLIITPCLAVVAASSLEDYQYDTTSLRGRNGKGGVICEPFGSCERCPEGEVCVISYHKATSFLTICPDTATLLSAFRQPSVVTLSRSRLGFAGGNASMEFVWTYNSAREGRLLRVYGKVHRTSAVILPSNIYRRATLRSQ